MPHSCTRIYQAMMSSAWAIDPVKARALRGMALRALAGQDISQEQRSQERLGQGRQGSAGVPQAGVAVVPIVGVIVHRGEQVDDISAPGAVSAARLRAQMRELAKNDDVSAVVLDIESPGGAVDGIEELGNEIRRLASIKPVAAVANAYAASAAYWIAAQASEIVVTPSGEVGSIGVYTLHEDDTEMLKAVGIGIEIIRAGDHKIEANPFEPLSADARAELQRGVDRYYQTFTAAVARGRGMAVSELRAQPWGKGRMLDAKAAVEAGLADSVGTIETVIARLAAGGGVTRQSRRRAEALRASLDFS